MVAATLVFSIQDALSRVLVADHSVWMIVMIRYWVFAAAILLIISQMPGGVRAHVRTEQPLLQALRGLVLALEICVAVICFDLVGLVAYHAIFVSAPLMVAALSGPVLGEHVGWRRWSAIGIGAVGVLIVLQPGGGLFQTAALLPLLSAILFALYGLMTRYAARQDSAMTSFVWTGLAGAMGMTCVGVWFWAPMDLASWGWMMALSGSALLGHWLYIRAYAAAEASAIQPFAYFHFLFASVLGVAIFGDGLDPALILGAAVIIAAGLFAWWRERAVHLG